MKTFTSKLDMNVLVPVLSAIGAVVLAGSNFVLSFDEIRLLAIES